jgi:leucyl aminopeptidase
MTDCSLLLKADTGQSARTIHLVDSKGFEAWLNAQPPRHRSAISAHKFAGKMGSFAILPADNADEWSVVAGVADASTLNSWCLARLAEALPEGAYRLAAGAPGAAAHGWLCAQYSFERYRKKEETPTGNRVLLTTDIAQIDRVIATAQAVMLVRDMVNTPAADMGPPDIEAIAADIAKKNDADFHVTRGHDLETGYPMIYAVGKAAEKQFAPRLIEMTWGNPAHPRIAIIGKGVSFDSGGLDIKPSSAMRLMKKDMGGAAYALALAQLVMVSRLPVRLHVLVPCVENAISGNAFRPGDILQSRAGITVEIGNTDAEGRLILGDAITKAGEDKPALMINFATLTGAARVALGPDLPALFANDDDLGNGILSGGLTSDDPVWRMPLHAPYADMNKSDVADISNSGDSGLAGAITAALFLQKFVPDGVAWAHLDTFAWASAAKPGRPKGGEALGLRAVFTLLQSRYAK